MDEEAFRREAYLPANYILNLIFTAWSYEEAALHRMRRKIDLDDGGSVLDKALAKHERDAREAAERGSVPPPDEQLAWARWHQRSVGLLIEQIGALARERKLPSLRPQRSGLLFEVANAVAKLRYPGMCGWEVPENAVRMTNRPDGPIIDIVPADPALRGTVPDWNKPDASEQRAHIPAPEE